MTAGKAHLTFTLDDKAEEFLSLLRSAHERLDDKAEEFLSLLRSAHERLDEQERQQKELWRRIHSICEMIEDRDQH